LFPLPSPQANACGLVLLRARCPKTRHAVVYRNRERHSRSERRHYEYPYANGCMDLPHCHCAWIRRDGERGWHPYHHNTALIAARNPPCPRINGYRRFGQAIILAPESRAVWVTLNKMMSPLQGYLMRRSTSNEKLFCSDNSKHFRRSYYVFSLSA
jgi:hypothetical protein